MKKKPSFIEDEEDILEKLENEVSDYFNEGKEEKKKKKHKHSGSKDTDDKADDTKGSIILENEEDDIHDNISADLNDDISDNKNNNIKADISDNIKADLGMYDEEYPDSENDKTKDDEDMSIVDELSDDELKNIEIEDQAAATIDDEETVEKVLRESAGTFSSDVADIQEASRKNYRILGTIKE